MTDKTLLRKQMKALRDGIPAKVRKRHSAVIAQKVFALLEEMGATTVFAYLSFGSEVETLDLIQGMLLKKIRVAVPLCDTKSHTMTAVEIHSLDDVIQGAHGIAEPLGNHVILPEEIDLILVPGLAFDREGYRLGYGGGYYDRYLIKTRGISVGLAFSDCCTAVLPRNTYDLPVSRVLTE